jgi:hypothetical protein
LHDADAALVLIRLHDLVSAAREIGARLARELEDYAPSVVHTAREIEASSDRQHSITTDVADLLDVAELAHLIRESLPARSYRHLDVDTRTVIMAAADWLRSGIADTRQLRLAARLLPAREGLHALADSLSATEHPWASEATIRDLLGAFWQFPAALVDAIGDDAGIDADTRLDRLDAAEIPRLIDALRRCAERPEIESGR